MKYKIFQYTHDEGMIEYRLKKWKLFYWGKPVSFHANVFDSLEQARLTKAYYEKQEKKQKGRFHLTGTYE